MNVPDKANVGVAQQLHTEEVQHGVIFLVEAKGSGVGYFRIGGVFDFILIVVQEKRGCAFGVVHLLAAESLLAK